MMVLVAAMAVAVVVVVVVLVVVMMVAMFAVLVAAFNSANMTETRPKRKSLAALCVCL